MTNDEEELSVLEFSGLVARFEALFGQKINQILCLSVAIGYSQAVQSVEDCLCCTDPFLILSAEIEDYDVYHLLEIAVIIIRHSLILADSQYLVLNDLLKGQHCLLDDEIIRVIQVCKLE